MASPDGRRLYVSVGSNSSGLMVDGRQVRLVPLKHVLAFPLGAGGLHTTRLEVITGWMDEVRRKALAQPK